MISKKVKVNAVSLGLLCCLSSANWDTKVAMQSQHCPAGPTSRRSDHPDNVTLNCIFALQDPHDFLFKVVEEAG